MAAFIDNIRKGQQPEVTVRDGARATVGCLRMLESAQTYSVRSIELDDVLATI